MTRDLALLLSNKLVGLNFVQVLAGLVQTITKSDVVGEGANRKTVTNKIPVSADTNFPADCHVTAERLLIPNSKLANIIYFEDLGTAPYSQRRNTYQSSLRLVCWYNKSRLFENAAVNSNAVMQAEIIERLETKNPINAGMFRRMFIHPSRIPIRDASIFSKYAYNEEVRQYLMPPFDFFAIDFACTYELNTACLV